jgi:hypothetical protein
MKIRYTKEENKRNSRICPPKIDPKDDSMKINLIKRVPASLSALGPQDLPFQKIDPWTSCIPRRKEIL